MVRETVYFFDELISGYYGMKRWKKAMEKDISHSVESNYRIYFFPRSFLIGYHKIIEERKYLGKSFRRCTCLSLPISLNSDLRIVCLTNRISEKREGFNSCAWKYGKSWKIGRRKVTDRESINGGKRERFSFGE